ncbi:MAG: oxygenase MpaB family protein [Rhodoglobus sp.]
MVTPLVERYARDGVLILGGARAILLQIADPVVGAAVAEHSAFARRPMQRLRNTLTFVYAVTFGTPEQAATVARLVNRSHAGIRGAADAARQLWVAATLYETATLVHDAVFGPLEPAAADEVYRAYAALGEALQVPAGAWPPDRAAFARYWAETSVGLEVTEHARRVARELLHPVAVPWWVRPGMPLVRTLTAGMLPPDLRTAYDLPDHPRRYRAAVGFVRAVARITPRRLREWPSRHYLSRLGQ